MTVLAGEGLVKVYGRGRPALDGVSLAWGERETVAVVGESGCGKTTLARVLSGLLRPTEGRVLLDGEDVWAAGARVRRRLPRIVQIVFQDPSSALDPRQSVWAAVEEPLRLHHLGSATERRREVAELLEMVGLGPAEARRLPHQLSGGQRQRVLLARALALRPRLLILDEPVSALDVSVRAQVLNLLARVRRELGLGCLLISHDLAVVRHLAGRVVVMHAGRLVEEGPAELVWRRPAHPYTADLLAAHLVPDPARRPPPPDRPPAEPGGLGLDDRSAGCSYARACPRPTRTCLRRRPPLVAAEGRLCLCHRPDF